MIIRKRREVVAAILTTDAGICLLRRSSRVRSDKGLWHCITGYLDAGRTPTEQALLEVHEEAGFDPSEVRIIYQGAIEQAGWQIHVVVIKVVTPRRTVRLNWENDAYRWSSIQDAVGRGSVPWLGAVLHSVPACAWDAFAAKK